VKYLLKITGIISWLCILPLLSHAQPVTFQKGTWLKFKVRENGIYHLTYNDLRNAGLNPDDIHPSQIHLLAYPTGMLPQANNVSRPTGSLEVAITITGDADGKFDRNDEIIFYGQGPDKYQYVNAKNTFYYENNLYSDVNYYFLRISDAGGSRITRSNTTPGTNPVIDQFTDFGYYETDTYNDQKSGRDWFGEQFDVKNEITIRFAMPGIVPNSNITFVSNLMAQSYEYSYFKIFWNNIQVLDRKMDTIPQTQYGSKGTYGVDTLQLNSTNVNAPSNSNQDIKINFTKGGGNRSVGYLNYILFSVNRKIAKYSALNPTFFHIPYNNDILSDISVASFPADGTVWEVTDPFAVKEMQVSTTGDVAKFASVGDINRSFVVFSKTDMRTPEFVENVADQDLHNMTTPSLLIVSHPDFLSEANRLASHRSSEYGIDVKVVTTQQIYNEYSGGRQDITAIRDFVRQLYLTTPGKLQNLLLFGRGSYDYKDRVFSNTNYVPIYESRNSLDPLLTYSSDDYYGFLEDNEGQWKEDLSDDNTLDIGIGRLPVTDIKQAADVVDKLIAYDVNPEQSLGKQRVLFVADDGDWNIHQSQAEDLAETFEVLYKNYHTSKVYLDAYEQKAIASGQISPEAKEALQEQINRGYDIVNYTGHGSERVWMQERILDQDTPFELRNDGHLPLFLTATCEFGRNDDPLLISTAELLLMQKKRGAIGLVTTARPVNTITNSVLNKAFYAAYFEKTVQVKDLGGIFRQTKNKSLSGVANRNFSLLGDPSMRFDSPKEDIVITSLQTADHSPVLKSLSKVTMTGEIRKNNVLSPTFNGTIEVEVFDRRSVLTTRGDENSPFTYKMWDHSLFRGKAKVVDGEFALEFIMPEGVSDNIQNGKVLLYAYSSDKTREAQGAVQNLQIGGLENNPAADVSGPSIELFMGDTTFVNGGYTNSNTHLIGKLYDKSGLNISGYGGGVMVATLDGNETFVVNDYFIANEDDFTSGRFSFPISNLAEGHHTITFKATDTYLNPGTASITFIVGPNGALIVEDLYAYPNPFSELSPATIEFKHNRTGEDLEVQVVIYDALGQLADKRDFTVASSTYKVTLFSWDGMNPRGTKMSNGIYLVRLVIRSVSDGAKNGKIARLILTN
jgi:hypothetical protein